MPITGLIASVISSPYSNLASVTATSQRGNWISPRYGSA
jgi:hypothetical protein